MKAGERRFKEGLAALEKLLAEEFSRIFGETNQEGREAVKVANIAEKYRVCSKHLDNWRDRLAGLIQTAFERYTVLAVSNPQFVRGEPVEWVENHVPKFLEPRLGRQIHASPSKWTPDLSISLDEWFTGGQKAHNEIPFWVAEVSAAEGLALGYNEGGQWEPPEWEFDAEDVDSWQAPRWLDYRKNLRKEPLEGRLDAKATALKVGAIHEDTWINLQPAIRNARLRAQVEIAALPRVRDRKKTRKKGLTEREEVMWEAIRDGLKGMRYCSFLDRNEIKPPQTWTDYPV